MKSWVLAVALALFALGLFTVPAAAAATADELRSKIAEKNDAILNLEKEIKEYQRQLETTGKEKQSLQNAVALLDLSRKKISADIRITENKIAATDLHLSELSLQITDKETRIALSLSAVGAGLRTLAIMDADAPIVYILRGENMSEAWQQLEELDRFQQSIDKHVEDLRQFKEDLENTKAQTEMARKKLVSLKIELANQKKVLDANRQETSALLAATKNKESNYQKLLAEKQTLHRQFEEELSAYEAELRFTIDPTLLPKTGSGVLSWPLDAVFITQYFGNTEFATRNAQVYNGEGHNGIDLRAAPGTQVRAASSGVVQGTGNTDTTCRGASYGQWVLIRHNNGLSTLYAHLSVIAVSQGQSVSVGQIIGYSGSTGYATGPHLHFTVYATQGVEISQLKSRALACKGKIYTLPLVKDRGAYLNPLSYL
ncbi:hypothetical protein A2761_01620 [Candidatus Kaiserbacteria bacterium RIFCSPHIGHO2_01_FULL_51_33]|uniref:M23ase beta-sheet core domain-containing protein n=1 Tax=Candidatus Kaiserbacteria bacterium RIFCSPLOWO2_01_FULL_51_21 TaxID=1798508 RepID=A0A1F6EDX1_9BACT|nr:MAG: hypothetical protein A2761_01620 [Candidatus Kaiserbacteria bacterium RIFCSPHIGHO2_01_FULL_51_33]OGG71807.1 MAG: hypothetical protein A3A35_02705 [Candidatus Kaiserbacteria bacterium RIFCSPLOWO2_01_FULL_51_21]